MAVSRRSGPIQFEVKDLSSFASELRSTAEAVDGYLSVLLDRQTTGGAPERLIEATRHAVLGGGKRFRPFLVVTSASLFGVSLETALPAAAAIECVHCYSLVHDDLPAMDHDEFRRGKPTVWKAYDEWTAILVGDGLQALAFELISGAQCHEDAGVRSSLVLALARAGGNTGMVGGQALDLAAGKTEFATPATLAQVTKLQAMKTGRLVEAACEMGAILGKADARQREALLLYGANLGAAFQISDDLLDAEGSIAMTGKATGKDGAAGKATLVGLLGIAGARQYLDRAVASAIAALDIFGNQSAPLAEAAIHLGKRET